MEIFESYTGPGFLAFYAAMLATCVFLGFWIAANLRPTGRKGEVGDMEEVAVLVGGADQHLASVLSDLFVNGALLQTGKKKFTVAKRDLGTGQAGKAVLSKAGDFSFLEARITLKDHAERIEQRLIKRGLMIPREERWKLRTLSALPYLALLLIGLYRQQAGAAVGEPTGLLIGLLGITVALGLLRLIKFNPRTMAGNAMVREIEERGSRLKRAPQANEAGYAVAIFGTGVLVGTPWEPVHAARQAGSGGDAGYSGDGDGGGSGCGGGCGGCGG